MAERLHHMKVPEVVVQLNVGALDGFLRNLTQALGELSTEVIESKNRISMHEGTCAALIKQVSREHHSRAAVVAHFSRRCDPRCAHCLPADGRAQRGNEARESEKC
jgi:hypothetical protein